MRIAVAGAIAGLVLVAGACGSSTAKVTASVTGGTRTERSLAREILQKLAPSLVTSVVFRGLQHDAIHHWPGRRMDVHGPTSSVDQEWEQQLFGYSYAFIARQRHVPIGFVTLDTGFGLLDDALARAPTTPIDDGDLHAFEKALRSSAKTAHATIAFRELRPGPVALEATFTTSKPLALIREHLLPVNAPKGLFGFLLQILRPNDEIAFAEASSPGGGITSADPTLLGCFLPYMHFTGPPQVHGPTCPA